jgi:hypothetical protein
LILVRVLGVSSMSVLGHIVPTRRAQIVLLNAAAEKVRQKASADKLWVNVHRAASMAIRPYAAL